MELIYYMSLLNNYELFFVNPSIVFHINITKHIIENIATDILRLIFLYSFAFLAFIISEINLKARSKEQIVRKINKILKKIFICYIYK